MFHREEDGPDPLEYFQPQTLLQMGPWDCGVDVFRKLAGLTREELLRELPEAIDGIPVIRWEHWLTSRGLLIERRQPGEEYALPCAPSFADRRITTGSMKTAPAFTIPIASSGTTHPSC